MYVTVALRDVLYERRFLAHIEVASLQGDEWII
jgi:hypothetical protein